MATEYLFSNNATTTLAQSVSATATVLNVASGDGVLFPSPSSGQAFAVTLVDAATGLKNEICYCTSRSGDQLTVVRGREGTNAIAWSAGDTCANYITADVMESWLQESDLNGYATQSWADRQYIRSPANPNTDARILTISRNKTSGGIFAAADDGSNTQLQPSGDYATNPALNSVNTNLQNQINNRVLKTGDTMTGTLTLTGAYGVNTGYSWSEALTLENQYSGSTAQILCTTQYGVDTAVRLKSTWGNNNNTVLDLHQDGTITTTYGTVAFESDISNLQNQINNRALKSELPLPEGMHCQVFSAPIPSPCPEEGWLVDIPSGWKTHSFVTACDTGANVYAVSAKVENNTQARLWAKYPTNGAWAMGGEVTVTSFGYF